MVLFSFPVKKAFFFFPYFLPHSICGRKRYRLCAHCWLGILDNWKWNKNTHTWMLVWWVDMLRWKICYCNFLRCNNKKVQQHHHRNHKQHQHLISPSSSLHNFFYEFVCLKRSIFSFHSFYSYSPFREKIKHFLFWKNKKRIFVGCASKLQFFLLMLLLSSSLRLWLLRILSVLWDHSYLSTV